MIRRIKKLEDTISNKIAAGEVVERPSSVVKELIENSIDAMATNITIEVENAGKSFIRVTDNGSGIYMGDIEIAFQRHATSKISSVEDIYNIRSLGFRGEALASIASVSKVEVITKNKENNTGIKAIVNNGMVDKIEEIGCPVGTTMIVKDLFFNTPARYKFLKSDSVETNYISLIVNKLALSHPKISFKYILDNRVVFITPGNGNIYDTIYTIYGKNIAKNLIKIDKSLADIKIYGYTSNLKMSRGNKQLQIIFVNGRYISSKLIKEAINSAYKSLLINNRFPICFLYIDLPPNKVDINIHPSKTEVRFNEENKVKGFIYSAIKDSVLNVNLIPKVDIKEQTNINNTDMVIKDVSKTTYIEDKKEIKQKDNINIAKKKDHNDGFVKDIYKVKSNQVENNVVDNEKEQIDIFINEVLKNTLDITNIDNEEKNDLEFSKEIFKELRVIGQIFNTYIICEKENQMYLIDQHAAHEKILYEDYLDSFSKKEILSQILLEPIVINTNYIDKQFVLDNKDFFGSLGYKVEDFGHNTIIIREVPMVFGVPTAKSFFYEVLDNYDKIENNNNIALDKIIKLSCKKAIKANDQLKSIEIEKLLIELSRLNNPFTCPHGRPVIISITKNEIEKKFKRT